MTNNLDPLLQLFHELLKDEKEKEIITMIFQDLSEEKIIESLIDYKEDQKKEDDKI